MGSEHIAPRLRSVASEASRFADDQKPYSPIRVLVADDHAVVRAGFSAIIKSQVNLRLLGSVSGGDEAMIWLERCPVEVLLLDLRMPGMSGLDVLLKLRKLPFPPQAIVLSGFEPDELVCAAVEVGAKGFLLKDTSDEKIIEAIHAVYSGRNYFPQWVEYRVSERKLHTSLSHRELEVLEMVSKGLTNREIGHAIQVSHLTVRNHVRHIIEKLDVADRTEAATVAIQQGILFAC